MSSSRIKILIINFFLLSFIISVKLFYWQIISGEKLSAQAESQYQSLRVIPGSRGLIHTSDNFPIINNREIYNLFINQQRDYSLSGENLDRLVAILEPDETLKEKMKIEIKNKFENRDLAWSYLAKSIVKEQKQSIENLKIKGLDFESEEKRDYPEASMSAHLLGFVGKNSIGSNQGYFGLEGYYDRELRSRSGTIEMEKDAFGISIPIGKTVENQAIVGRDLYLYLDRGIQFMVEEKLKLALTKYGAKAGLVVIIDPKTGGLISSASFPNYDPGNYSSTDRMLFPDPVVSQTFEPGSVFKVLVMASALNEGVIKVDEQCSQCFGPRVIGEYTVRTWDDKYHPNSTMTEILQHSDNIGMVYVAEKLGRQKLYRDLNNFGIGQLTNVDLTGEINIPLRSPEKWADIDLATISFGQGVAVTPIEMVSAVGAIANGGKLLEPHAVNKITDSEKTMEIRPKIIRQPITETTAKVMTELMVSATQYGEAKWAAPKGYRIAGKTGTAQIPIAGHYDSQKTIASFVGFAPADNPKFVMLVSLTEPTSSPWGSETAAPLWFDIAKEIFKIRGILPS
ncbi:hypothetical protein COT44_04655 [Candidatus Shapirobacteria bacterium CG08_land_8_20_14_0_20_39_18]|uniref:Penicillin-binding protein 2 n=1 Tax=Candidatus Shapirobacteria bacterium CG08_land_8_20_14_0_20_39_18 TaxID=1974883 RepID=A0A2M6XBW6_9BACT|nr:MAG: hypothetical protein COT44_04655 [Candidatus Shapirobacteria bacterium CG08_land_8_20_14_0_20_39_18]PIY65345.1 MAG: hypothetical protein COY91_02945 [Candidatus Shapirobacteria bacterium CG_4_10_14_0_8_um_filter_39_15]PJE68196.1 MAG: hypothetical protein COU94_03120 [Candidatus Shapirobacteria bacterium CG10_big_fil_rev_8_21_14_0_10_38_8]